MAGTASELERCVGAAWESGDWLRSGCLWQVGLAVTVALGGPLVLALALSVLSPVTGSVYGPATAATIPTASVLTSVRAMARVRNESTRYASIP